MPIFSNLSINQTICGCDGGLTISVFGGSPPYSYSIDNGITFNSFPIYTNLCQGNYTIVVNDVSGETTTNFATLNPPSNPITYTVYLSTSSQNLVSSPNQQTIEYVTSISVFPPLPSGTTISFKLNHSNLVKSSPNITSASGSSNSQLVIDSTTISASTSGSTTGSTFNPIPGCQDQTLYLKTFNNVWNNVSVTYGTEFTLTTTDTLYKNDFVDCYIGSSEHTFSISDLSISGCSCCTIISG